ncbi:F-box protein [Phanerochaete sordida]|uniref:F-box protein n=1 Tax=Phanerochaete sordida TaxID=48140 RepID=A0A9P3G8Z7_9APHY|nr:F-box protein [Phanerochaete sordida]
MATAAPVHIAELLALVFSHLDPASLARAARVCRPWAPVALDALWHTVRDLRPLLALLAPLTGEKRSTARTAPGVPIKFKRPLQAADWQRTDRYAYRVRVLDLDDRRARRQLDAGVFAELQRTCPRAATLPNLVSATFPALDAPTLRRAALFLHPGLRHLSFHAHVAPEHPLARFVDEVLQRAPRLTRLEVRSHHAMHELQDALRPLFTGLRDLRHVTLPLYGLTSDVLAALSNASRIETVALAEPVERGTGARADVADVSFSLPPTAFPALRSLALATHIPQATLFLAQPHAPHNISSLRLHVLAPAPPPAVHALLGAATSCTSLTSLTIDFLLGPGAPIAAPPPAHARLSLDTLRPLLACTRLQVLEIRWDYALALHDADMPALAAAWPLLHTLHLHADALPSHTPPPLTLAALLPFAALCPHLETLALHLDGDTPLPRGPLPRFTTLRTLALGSSPLRAPRAAARALSALLPAACAVGAGVRWPDAWGVALDAAGVGDARRQGLAEWWGAWAEVGRLVGVCVEVREDERARLTWAEGRDGGDEDGG